MKFVTITLAHTRHHDMQQSDMYAADPIAQGVVTKIDLQHPRPNQTPRLAPHNHGLRGQGKPAKIFRHAHCTTELITSRLCGSPRSPRLPPQWEETECRT